MIAVFGVAGVVILVVFIIMYKSKNKVAEVAEYSYLKEAGTVIMSSAPDATDVNVDTGEVITEGDDPWMFSSIVGAFDKCKETCTSLKNCMGFSRQVGLESDDSLTCYMKTGQGEK